MIFVLPNTILDNADVARELFEKEGSDIVGRDLKVDLVSEENSLNGGSHVFVTVPDADLLDALVLGLVLGAAPWSSVPPDVAHQFPREVIEKYRSESDHDVLSWDEILDSHPEKLAA